MYVESSYCLILVFHFINLRKADKKFPATELRLLVDLSNLERPLVYTRKFHTNSPY